MTSPKGTSREVHLFDYARFGMSGTMQHLSFYDVVGKLFLGKRSSMLGKVRYAAICTSIS